MTFLVSQVESWRAELAALPPPDLSHRKVGKRAAVALLAKELLGLVRRGYNIADLLEVLATKGLIVQKDTLRRALRSARPAGATEPARRRKVAKRDRIQADEPSVNEAATPQPKGETRNDPNRAAEALKPQPAPDRAPDESPASSADSSPAPTRAPEPPPNSRDETGIREVPTGPRDLREKSDPRLGTRPVVSPGGRVSFTPRQDSDDI